MRRRVRGSVQSLGRPPLFVDALAVGDADSIIPLALFHIGDESLKIEWRQATGRHTDTQTRKCQKRSSRK